MPLPTTRIELLENLQQAFVKLDTEFDDIDSINEKEKCLEGGISCCDIIAYQIGWLGLLMGWEKQELSGKTPIMPSKNFKWNQLGDLAQSFYDEHANKSLSQLRQEFKNIHQKLIEWINSLSDRELFEAQQRTWTGEKWAIVKWIQVNSIAPYRSARTKVRRWKKAR